MSEQKIEAFWENATADDVAGIANTRKSIQARFRDEGSDDWSNCLLVGWKLSKHLPGAWWIDSDGTMWDQCQVYREPSWWTNKPDPGPGWRLLEKFPDEELKLGDEIWLSHKKWARSANAEIGEKLQQKDAWYRRRIEPVEPEPKHYVLRVGDSVETPSGHKIKVISRTQTREVYSLMAGDGVSLPNGQTITITAKGFEVTQ
jgi:hypothetical protein